MTEAVWKADPALHPWPHDADPMRLYSWLARSFRGSMLARALPRSIRYLHLRDGDEVEALLDGFFREEDPKLYTPLEAKAFRDWLLAQGEEDPLMISLLDYDIAFLKLIREGQPQVITFPGDPTSVFEALAEARLPETPPPPPWEIEILPDSFTIEDFSGTSSVS